MNTISPGSESESVTDLIDPGLTNVLFDTWLASRAVDAVIDHAIKASGLTADEFAIYSVLASGAGLTPSDLAGWMAAPATSVSSYVKRFERRGHVRRVPNPKDRRSYRVELTAKGRKVHREAGALFQPALLSVETALGAAVVDTRQQLRALRRAIDELVTNDSTSIRSADT